MAIPVRQKLPTRIKNLVIQVTDDGSRTLMRESSESEGNGYHSGCGALSETLHVYLRNSGIADRLAAGEQANVLEIGLGSGMGLLATVDHAIQHDAPLRYVAFENDWVPADIIEQLDPQSWVTPSDLHQQFLSFRRRAEEVPRDDETYHWDVTANQHAVILTQDFLGADNDNLLPSKSDRFHAVYFDPFAPAINPELWRRPVFSRLRSLLAKDGKLVTYCVSRAVRDEMTACGFHTDRVPGPPGGKREVLIATNPG